MAFDMQSNTRTSQALVVSCVVAAVLQVALAPQIALFGGRVNFMLALVAALSLRTDSSRMVYVGFAAGLFYDLTSPVPVGLMALLLTVLGYVLSTFARGMGSGAVAAGLRLVCAGVLVVNLVNAIVLVATGVAGNLLVALGSHAISSSLLTIIASLPFVLFTGGASSARGGSRLGTSRPSARYKSLR